MIRSFKKAFETSPTVQLEVVKKSQIYVDASTARGFLTNRSTRPGSVYPVIQNSTLHLNPGDRLTALNFKKSVDGRRNCGVWVARDSDGMEFEIFTDDLKRYIKIV